MERRIPRKPGMTNDDTETQSLQQQQSIPVSAGTHSERNGSTSIWTDSQESSETVTDEQDELDMRAMTTEPMEVDDTKVEADTDDMPELEEVDLTPAISPVKLESPESIVEVSLPPAVRRASLVREAKRCWVCFEDDEESEEDKTWIRPCKCKGSIMWCHEDCLLRYIQSRKDSLKPVQCPQCHTIYKIVEPNPLLLRLLVMGDQSLQALMPYLTFMGITSTAVVMFTTYGAYALITLGSEEGLLRLRWSWRTWVGLPLIPVVLICSRTEFLDPILPALPLVLFRHRNMEVRWPPSRAMLLSALPWIRAIYNGLYGKLYARATGRRGRDSFDRPRESLLYNSNGSHQHVIGANNVPIPATMASPGASISVSSDGNGNSANGMIAATIAAQRVMERVNAQADGNDNNNNNAGNTRQTQVTSHFTTTTSTSDGSSTITTISRTATDSDIDIEDTEYETTILERRDLRRVVIGALFLPAISSTMGSILSKVRFVKVHLPDLFHRNILGGCLFILVKDLCLLSYTYLKRRQFEMRRVRNYDP